MLSVGLALEKFSDQISSRAPRLLEGDICIPFGKAVPSPPGWPRRRGSVRTGASGPRLRDLGSSCRSPGDAASPAERSAPPPHPASSRRHVTQEDRPGTVTDPRSLHLPRPPGYEAASSARRSRDPA